MAIGTDARIEFHGTQDTIHSTPATVADGAFSVSTDVSQWTNDDDAPFAYFTLALTAVGLGGAPSLGATVGLYTRLMNTQSTNDDQAPQANFEHTFLGVFPIRNADADQRVTIGPVRIPNVQTSQVHEFYIQNNLGVATGTTWELYVTPATVGPHA